MSSNRRMINRLSFIWKNYYLWLLKTGQYKFIIGIAKKGWKGFIKVHQLIDLINLFLSNEHA